MNLIDPEIRARLNLMLGPCTEPLFDAVKKYIRRYELDDRFLKPEEFVTLCKGSEVFGFGRLRQFEGYAEICSLGIVEDMRSLGFGAAITRALVKKASTPLYLVCIIPGFFEKLGFDICRDYPPGIQEKLNYCTAALPVPEPYVVMKAAQGHF